MAHDPERHGDLAMLHVLGGLEGEDATAFREHLTGCAECRRRVAELRGIAADLQQVDRRERASMAALRTEARAPSVAPDPGDDEPPAATVSERVLGIALVIGIVLLVGLAFWNFHLRDREATLFAVIDSQQEVLDLLVAGRPVATELPGGAAGTAVVRDGRFALDVSGIDVEDGDRVVLWFYGDDGALLPRTVSRDAATLPGDGLFATSGFVGDAVRVVVSLEQAVDLRAGPGQRVVLEALLVEPSSD